MREGQGYPCYQHDMMMIIEFGLEKCAKLIIKCGKRETMEGKELLDRESIWMLEEKKNYKYLGILEVDTIKQSAMKEKKQNKKTVPP